MKRIAITWQGETAYLKEDQAFEVADAVEDVITFGELVQMRQNGANIRFAKVSAAYAALLCAVGIDTTPRAVHSEIMRSVREAKKEQKLSLALEAIDWLLIVLMDGAPDLSDAGKDTASGNAPPPAS